MKVLDQARVVIYRFHEAGLEVFLIEPNLHEKREIWSLPAGVLENSLASNNYKVIELDEVEDSNGEMLRTYAIEADWHEIPSIRGILKQDVKRVKNKIKEVLPGLDNGGFFGVKDAFKKVLPNEYAALKELKDILLDRNTVTNF